MKEDFKKWLCKLAQVDIFNCTLSFKEISTCEIRKKEKCKTCNHSINDGNTATMLEILIKAMWKLEGKNPNEEIKKLEQELLEKFNNK